MISIPEYDDSDETETEQDIVMDGIWERKGRSLLAAATLGLFGIGLLYANGQGLLVIIGIVLVEIGSAEPGSAGTVIDQLMATAKLHATPLQISVVISLYLFMLLPTWLLVKRWHSHSVRQYLLLVPSSFTEILLAVLATLAFIPAGNYIVNELTRWIQVPEALLEINALIFSAESISEFLWLVLVVAVTPAFCEEIFFRGYVQRTFERVINAKSIILAGIIFGLFHMQPLGLITLAMFGILFGYFYYRSRSLFPSMAAHFTNNFVAIFLLYKAPSIGGVGLENMDNMPLVLVLITLVVGFFLVYLYHKATAFKAASLLDE